MMVLVTGGCGYCGSVLVPKLLDKGHVVTVLDAMWFGENLAPRGNLVLVQEDLRNIGLIKQAWFEKFDAVIHLAGIANDPCGDLDAKLTWEVNVLATTRLADACTKAGVKQFIFASSASIYGIKDNRPVTEDEPFEPVSDYNKTKMVAERALLSYADKFALQIVRPATVCGWSPRMRLDTIVNMLTMQAIETRKITAHCGAHGGKLVRPHAHIEDITDLYCWLLERPHITGAYNAGFENMTVEELAAEIAAQVECEVTYTEVADKRSYAVDSSRLKSLGFVPRFSVPNAVASLVRHYNDGTLRRRPDAINLEWMRSNGIAA